MERGSDGERGLKHASQVPTPEHPARFLHVSLAGLPAYGFRQLGCLWSAPPSRTYIQWQWQTLFRSRSRGRLCYARLFDGTFPFHSASQAPTENYLCRNPPHCQAQAHGDLGAAVGLCVKSRRAGTLFTAPQDEQSRQHDQPAARKDGPTHFLAKEHDTKSDAKNQSGVSERRNG